MSPLHELPCRFVFCASPGRSGSHFLAQLFASAQGTFAVHEPEHQFPEYAALRPSLWDLRNRRLADSHADRRNLKLAQLGRSLELSGAQAYVETNPMFTTLWHDVILDFMEGREAVVIILRRQTAKVLKSILDLGWFQGRDGNAWMVTSHSVNSLFPPLGPEADADPFDLVLDHLHNNALYASRIRQRCMADGHRLVELRSEDLFRRADMASWLLDECGLVADATNTGPAPGLEANKAAAKFKRFDVSPAQCMDAIGRYTERCARAGLALPGDFPIP